jgi:hypothetical protein
MLRYETLIAVDELLRERQQTVQRQALLDHLLATQTAKTREQPWSWRRLLPRTQQALVKKDVKLVVG